MRERSLEVFDDEKVLENIAIGPLFGRERLSFDLLETFPCWPPVEQLNLGSGPWLIIENYTTYYSISSLAKELGFAGRVVWGSGNQVGTRLSALVAATDSPPACWYFGDVDAGGFRAAKLAMTRAAKLGLPMMSPALGLYDLALRHGTTRRAGRGQVPGELVTWTRTWLPHPSAPITTSPTLTTLLTDPSHAGLLTDLGHTRVIQCPNPPLPCAHHPRPHTPAAAPANR